MECTDILFWIQRYFVCYCTVLLLYQSWSNTLPSLHCRGGSVSVNLSYIISPLIITFTTISLQIYKVILHSPCFWRKSWWKKGHLIASKFLKESEKHISWKKVTFVFFVLLILWWRWRPSRVRTDTPSNSYFSLYLLLILWWRWRLSRVRTDTSSNSFFWFLCITYSVVKVETI